jgi:hypothetical protein
LKQSETPNNITSLKENLLSVLSHQYKKTTKNAQTNEIAEHTTVMVVKLAI